MKNIPLFLLPLAIFISAFAVGHTSHADAFDSPVPPTPPSIAEGIATTSLAVTESDYFDVSLATDYPVTGRLSSIPGLIEFSLVNADVDRATTTLTLSGLTPHTEYHLYTDTYRNHIPFTTDANGSFAFSENLSQGHNFWIQERPSTIFINDSATGGDCSRVGEWNASTKTCTLSSDIRETIEIGAGGVTIDGAGHSITGYDTGTAVNVYQGSGTVIKNLTVDHFSIGIGVGMGTYGHASNNVIIQNLTIRNIGNAFVLGHGDSIGVSDITITTARQVLEAGPVTNLHFSRVTATNVHAGTPGMGGNHSGIALWESVNPTLTDITMSGDTDPLILYKTKYATLRNVHITGFPVDFSHLNGTQHGTFFQLEGTAPEHFDHDIDQSNTINSKPIKYWRNLSNMSLDASNAAAVICVACTNVEIGGADLRNTYHGIYLYGATDTVIASSSVQNSGIALMLRASDRVTIKDDTVTNTLIAAMLDGTNNSSILRNTFRDINSQTLRLENSDNNLIMGNTLHHNYAYLDYDPTSQGNRFYRNSLDAPISVHGMMISDASGANVYSLPLPDGGNWWENYDTPEEGCTDTNNDHVCDQPYNIRNMAYQGPALTDEHPWTGAGVWVPAEPTLGQKAAALAKEVVNAPYLGDGDTFGGKGWDSYAHQFVAPATVFSGYNFWNNKLATTSFGAGLDCSGLVMWAFNRANDPAKPHKKNIVTYEGADGQYRNNLDSTLVAKENLQPGDLLFFSADGNPYSHKDHVAMYVGGDSGTDVVEAQDPISGIVVSSLEESTARNKFIKQFRRIAGANVRLRINAASPIDLAVTDPDGFTIDSHTAIQTAHEYLREIPGELYYSEMTMGHDGKPADSVYSPVLKNGTYRVRVVPEPDALPTDTYSLTFTANGSTTVLTDNKPISSIPAGGFIVQVAGNNTTVVEVDTRHLFADLKQAVNAALIRPSTLRIRLSAHVVAAEYLYNNNRIHLAGITLRNLKKFVQEHSGKGIATADAHEIIEIIDQILTSLNP